MKLQPLADRYLRSKVASRLSEFTIDNYRYSLRAFMAGFHELPLDAEDIEAWLIDRADVVGDTSVQTNFIHIRTFYRWLVHRHLIDKDDNPIEDIDPPRATNRLPRF